MAVRMILNIGLSSYTGSKYEPDLEAMLVTMRKPIALAWVGSLGYDFYIEDRSHPVLDRGHEPTLVVVLFNVKMKHLDFDAKVHKLCEDIGQFCIAATFQSDWISPRTVFGRLIGPDTTGYEPFDNMKFIQPNRRLA